MRTSSQHPPGLPFSLSHSFPSESAAKPHNTALLQDFPGTLDGVIGLYEKVGKASELSPRRTNRSARANCPRTWIFLPDTNAKDHRLTPCFSGTLLSDLRSTTARGPRPRGCPCCAVQMGSLAPFPVPWNPTPCAVQLHSNGVERICICRNTDTRGGRSNPGPKEPHEV